MASADSRTVPAAVRAIQSECGVAYVSGFFGLVLRKFQTGRIQTYLLFVILGMVILFYMLR